MESASEKYFGSRGRDLRRRPNKRKTFQVEKMWESHKEIARMKVLGMKHSDIAREMGVSQAMVNYTLNSPVVEKQVAVMSAMRDCETVDLAMRIKKFAPICFDLLEKVIAEGKVDNEPAPIHLRVRTAQDYADRAGFGAVKKHQIVSARMSREDIEQIKQKAREAGVICVPAERMTG